MFLLRKMVGTWYGPVLLIFQWKQNKFFWANLGAPNTPLTLNSLTLVTPFLVTITSSYFCHSLQLFFLIKLPKLGLPTSHKQLIFHWANALWVIIMALFVWLFALLNIWRQILLIFQWKQLFWKDIFSSSSFVIAVFWFIFSLILSLSALSTPAFAFQLFTHCLQVVGLKMRSVTWNRFRIKNLLMDSNPSPVWRLVS